MAATTYPPPQLLGIPHIPTLEALCRVLKEAKLIQQCVVKSSLDWIDGVSGILHDTEACWMKAIARKN